MKQIIKLTPESRSFAIRCIQEAPDGLIVEISEPTRTLDQNALMWPLLTEFSKQLEWPVNGVMRKLTPDEWKDILSAAFRRDAVQIAPGIGGGTVIIGHRTSRFGVKEMSDFIEFMYAIGIERGVTFLPKGVL